MNIRIEQTIALVLCFYWITFRYSICLFLLNQTVFFFYFDEPFCCFGLNCRLFAGENVWNTIWRIVTYAEDWFRCLLRPNLYLLGIESNVIIKNNNLRLKIIIAFCSLEIYRKLNDFYWRFYNGWWKCAKNANQSKVRRSSLKYKTSIVTIHHFIFLIIPF